MDLLISFQWGRFYPMRRELVRIFKKLGDNHPVVEWTAVDGIAVAHTFLNNREVVQKCRELLHATEASFEFAVKWVPVDYWCDTDLDEIKHVLDKHANKVIRPDETWAMRVHKRRWQRYHKAEIVAYLAPSIDRRVNLTNPDKIVWIDIIGRRTAVSILEPNDIFSVVLEQ